MTHRHRYEDPAKDLMKLAGRIAAAVSYGMTKREVAERYVGDEYTADEVYLAYCAAKVMLAEGR